MKYIEQFYSQSKQSQENKNSSIPTTVQELFQSVSKIRVNSDYLKVATVLFSLNNRYRNVYAAQQWISTQSGVCRRTVGRAIEFFRKEGWLWTDHPYNSSLIYYFNPIFKQYDIRQRLKHLIPAFQFFMMCELFVSIEASGRVIPESVAPLYSYEVTKVSSTAYPDYHRWWEDGERHSASLPLEHYMLKKQVVTANRCQMQHPTEQEFLKKGSIMSIRQITSEVLMVAPDLTESQLLILDQYTDAQIRKAIKRVEMKQPDRPEAYLLAALRGIHEQEGKITQQQEKQQKDKLSTEQIQANLNDRYTKAEIEHCEKILALFDKISVEDPEEALKIMNRQVSDRWSMSWGTPTSFEQRLRKIRGS